MQDYLIDKTKLDLPSDFLKKWLLATNDGKLTEEQIDYILCRPAEILTLDSVTLIPELQASDHRPLLAVFSYR